MNKKTTIIVGSLLACSLISYQAMTFSGGAPQARNGSPVSSGSCLGAGCHSGGAASTETVTITTDIPATGFEENTDYTITVTASDGGSGIAKMGFEASVETPAPHAAAGTLTPGGNTQVMNAGAFITHTFSGTAVTGGTKTWSFDWNSGTSPDSSMVYVAVNFSNNNSSPVGDIIVLESEMLTKKVDNTSLLENGLSSFAIAPNPAIDLTELSEVSPEVAQIQIFDLSGKMIRSFGLEHQLDATSWSLPLEGLNKGTYLLKTDKADKAQKLVIAN